MDRHVRLGSRIILWLPIFFILFIGFPLIADPWGKDADLALNRPECHHIETPKRVSILAEFGIKAIRFHQEVISPADGPRSHFIPSSSQYALDAMSKYGFFKGVAMGCDRLMRENSDSWVYRKILDPAGREMKWDPVP